MTNKEKAAQLWDLARDEGRSVPERRAALAELLELKKGAKTSWDKLGIGNHQDGSPGGYGVHLNTLEAAADPLAEEPVGVFTSSEHALKLEEVAPPEVVEQVKEVLEKAAGDRGAISLTVRGLLKGTELPYSDIVAQVLAKHPHATTTTRSVASVASEMRAKGEDVPTRRAAAKQKEA